MEIELEKLELIKKLVEEGKQKKIIKDIVNLSRSTLQRICIKYNIFYLKTKIFSCKNCNRQHIVPVYDTKIFCNRKCSALFNNKLRITTDETKQKRSQTIKKLYDEGVLIRKHPKRIKISHKEKHKLLINKKCKHCAQFKQIKYFSHVCENCKQEVNIYYRQACRFVFNVYKFPLEFNIEKLKSLGWYKAKNRGDNFNGMTRDHLYSVIDGFKNKINPEILKHPANCNLIQHKENLSKGKNSSITLEELIVRIKEFDDKYVTVVEK